MATRESIEFDFRKALNQADEIDEIANHLRVLSTIKFNGALQNLAANWKGSNASAYLNKGEHLQNNMNHTSGVLHDIASDIRAAAKRMYQAEMAALEIAQTRSY